MNAADSKEHRIFRADVHVHSFHSGYSTSFPLFRARDSYSDPDEVYRLAKSRGMDLVTITDHDSIDGCLEFLSRHPDAPDFIVGEEIECRLPDGDVTLHVGALGIDERIHREIQPLRDNAYDVAALLREEGVAFCLNHPFMYYRDQVELMRYVGIIASHFPAMEARNGTMLSAQNELVERIVADGGGTGRCMGRFGGSDAHVLQRVGTTWTVAPASSREEFLESLIRGESRVGGEHGTTWVLAREIYGVIFNYWASLLGLGAEDLVGKERLKDLSLSAVSVPFQFVPFLVAAAKKTKETRRLELLGRRWRAFMEGESSRASDPELALDATPRSQ
jgi:predicted metal-dependent phosphoesterase TrpH